MDAVQVVGAGGIGCAVGCFLRAAGVGVTFVDADAAKVAWGRRHGVAVDRRPALPATFVHFAEWEPPADATVLLCTKCYDNAAVLARLTESITLIPIQNGFDPLLRPRHHAEGIASFVSECLPGRPHTRLTRNGRLHLGRGGDASGPAAAAQALRRTQGLADALRRAPFRVEVVPDVRPYKYAKLMYNAAIGPLAAAAGLDNGDLLRLPAARRLFFALLRENHAVLARAGVPLGKVGPLHPATVARILRRPLVANALAWAFYPSLRGTYCSMSADLPAGRTEIDYYNRHLIDLAGDGPCPLNRRVYALIKHMETEGTPPGPATLERLSTGPARVAA
jgi:2-dehydropantoate 2-reductase